MFGRLEGLGVRTRAKTSIRDVKELGLIGTLRVRLGRGEVPIETPETTITTAVTTEVVEKTVESKPQKKVIRGI